MLKCFLARLLSRLVGAVLHTWLWCTCQHELLRVIQGDEDRARRGQYCALFPSCIPCVEHGFGACFAGTGSKHLCHASLGSVLGRR